MSRSSPNRYAPSGTRQSINGADARDNHAHRHAGHEAHRQVRGEPMTILSSYVPPSVKEKRLRVANANRVIARANEITLDAHVIGFTIVTSLCTAIVFGLWPALRWAWHTHGVSGELRSRTTGGGARALARRALVIAKVSLAVVFVMRARSRSSDSTWYTLSLSTRSAPSAG